MEDKELDTKLANWRDDILREVDRKLLALKDELELKTNYNLERTLRTFKNDLEHELRQLYGG